MTTKQAIERLNWMIEQCERYEDTVLQDDNEDMQELLHDTERDIETLRMAVRALESKPRWIPCSERMPTLHAGFVKMSDKLLLSCEDGGSCGCRETKVTCGRCVQYTDLTFETEEGGVCDGVVAWMPLPEIYKED